MLLAEQIRESNIAEYVLYMWQTEDLLRGFDFDIEKIEQTILNDPVSYTHLRAHET